MPEHAIQSPTGSRYRRNSIQAAGNAHNGAYISGVAVCIPAGHGGNFHGFVKMAFSIQKGHDADTGIGYDVADTGITVIAPFLFQVFPACTPVVRVFLMEADHCICYIPVSAGFGNFLKTGPDNFFDIRSQKSCGDGSAQEACSVDAVSVVGNAGCCLSVVGGASDIARD